MPRTRTLIALLPMIAVLGACSPSIPTAGPAAAAAGSPAAAGPGGVLGGIGGQMDVSKLCAAVPHDHVQRLFKDTAPSVTSNPLECDWGAGDLTVDIYFNDPSSKYLNDLFGPSSTRLPGVGDFAEWSQPVVGATVPFVGCHQGTTSITVTPGLDVDKTTLTFSGRPPIYRVDPASAAKYADDEAALCADLFTAGA